MKTASMVLGIIGGVVALLCALIFIFSGAFIGNLNSALFGSADRYSEKSTFNDGFDGGFDTDDELQNIPFALERSAKIAGMFVTALGIFSALGAVLAFIGGILVKKHRIMSGVFMLIGAFTGFFTCYGTLASIMLIIAGIFALIPDKPPAPYPPYPPQPTVYPPQPPAGY